MERVVYQTVRNIAELRVGQSIETTGRTLCQSDINLFCGLTGDMNPLHLSETEAAAGPAQSIVAPATMVQAMAIGLFAQTRWLAAVIVVFVGVADWRAEKPVFPGDTVRARVSLAGMRPTSDGKSHILDVLFEVFARRGRKRAEATTDPRVMLFTARFLARDPELLSMP